MKVIIIDDESQARENLIFKINKLNVKIDILGEARDIDEAEAMIHKLNPDLILLDISMPQGSGFELLDRFNQLTFETIFVTAYDQYALKAFQYFAVGYLLKPIDIDKLEDVLLKAEERHNKNESKENILQLSKYLLNNNRASIVAIPIESGLEFIEMDDIIKLEATDGYSSITLKSGKCMLSSKPLSYFLALLDPSLFFQVHRAFIINLNCIKKYHKVGFIIMNDESEIPLAKTKKAEFLNLFRR